MQSVQKQFYWVKVLKMHVTSARFANYFGESSPLKEEKKNIEHPFGNSKVRKRCESGARSPDVIGVSNLG